MLAIWRGAGLRAACARGDMGRRVQESAIPGACYSARSMPLESDLYAPVKALLTDALRDRLTHAREQKRAQPDRTSVSPIRARV